MTAGHNLQSRDPAFSASIRRQLRQRCPPPAPRGRQAHQLPLSLSLSWQPFLASYLARHPSLALWEGLPWPPSLAMAVLQLRPLRAAGFTCHHGAGWLPSWLVGDKTDATGSEGHPLSPPPRIPVDTSSFPALSGPNSWERGGARAWLRQTVCPPGTSGSCRLGEPPLPKPAFQGKPPSPAAT